MATVDELIIAIKADTKDLNKKLSKTNKQLAKTGKEAKKSGAALKGSMKGGAVAVAALMAVTVKLVSVIAKVGMEFEDLKDSLDVVFGSMAKGDDAMQRVMQFAQTTPFQVETVTKAFIALRSVGIEPTNRMLQTFADTASVSVDQLGVFEALVRTVQRSAAGGLGLEELNMLSDRGIPALKILQEELGLAKDEIAIFGKTAQGAKIITDALQLGLEKRFGGAMETKMDNLSTKTSNMSIAFKQLGDNIFKGQLGDTLKTLTDRLTDFAIAANKAMLIRRGQAVNVTDREVNKFGPSKANSGGKDGDWLNEENRILDAQLKKLKERSGALIATQLINIKNLKEAKDARPTRASMEVIEAYERAKVANLSEQNLIINDISNIEEERRVNNKRDAVVDQDAIKAAGIKLDLQTKLHDAYKKSVDPLKDVKDEIAKGTENLQMTYDELVKIGQIIKTELSFTEWSEGIQSVVDKKEDFVGMQQEMRDAIAQTSQAFAGEFVDSLMEGENALESFKNLAKNLVSQIISIFLEMAVINEILNAVFGLEGDQAFTTMRNRKQAGGGKVQGGQPVVVGERGAEIFVPDSGGTIMNNMNSKGMGGGTTVVVNQSVNFATGIVPTVRAEVQKMMPMISDVTKGAVLEAAVRGGSFKKGLMGSG